MIRDLNARDNDAKEIKDEVASDKKEFCESTGVNKKALGWGQQLDKMKPENRMDVIRSLRRILDVMEGEWFGEHGDMLDAA